MNLLSLNFFSNLKLETECEAAQSEISNLEATIDELRSMATVNSRLVKKLGKQLDNIQQEETQLSSDFFDSET